MSKITFESKPFIIGKKTILLLPQSASTELPSRGMVMVAGTINGHSFRIPLEPDGRGSHWFEVDKALQAAAGVTADESAALEIESSKDWPEPELPADLKAALADDAKAAELWSDITPMARWDWLRWISSTGNSETRERRIRVAFSKLKNGSRRPCCFNRTVCTVMEVSKGGALLEPARA